MLAVVGALLFWRCEPGDSIRPYAYTFPAEAKQAHSNFGVEMIATHRSGTGVSNADMLSRWLQDAISDMATAAKLASVSVGPKLLTAWVFIPFGIMLILASCFAVHTGLSSAGVTFPASVACLILLFLALLLSERVLGYHRTRIIVDQIDVPAGWALRWINVFFTPSFILLPLSPSIGIAEVGRMIAVFLIGFAAMMAVAAYMTRGLQLLLGSSKRAVIERAEEMGNETNDLLLTSVPPADRSQPSSNPETPTISAVPSSASLNMMALSPPPRSQTPLHLFQEDNRRESHVNETLAVTLSSTTQLTLPAQAPLPPPRAQVWAAWLIGHVDLVVYAALFLFVGIPVYFATGYAMPAHLAFTVLCYFAAMSVAPKWRQYLHPVLVTALFGCLGIWALAALHAAALTPATGTSIRDALSPFRTGVTYQHLWSNRGGDERPGAGDIFATVLDAAIVALALPMYQYRRELRANFVAIIAPSAALSVASLFGYPAVCYAVGIEARRALAFAARSLTLALATPAVENLGGDKNTVAAVAIMSGIIGAVLGEKMLRLLRIPTDDYITRGVTLGINSSAIATAVLLRTDPRAAALSCLSMSVFGTITVLFTAVPPIVDVIRSLVGI
ncbi:uncharacterized protein DNG_09094 [Cephalotrichum gorgonifer]|uniref:LrgB domain-containing protein n=1 Tax=Cephalotrichum gorgonifer TaxID=2041049 RepID=A0AAE8SYZ2_9PEZI|nr:uncharacterized protein DNG_09094 [Cephalotrichum gorgonifer]